MRNDRLRLRQVWRCHSRGLDRSVNCNSFVHAWPESSGTAAQHCRRKGCIRHRLTLAHHDRPKPQARLPEGVGLLWASPRGRRQQSSGASSVGRIIHLCGVVIARTGDRGGLHKARSCIIPSFFCWVEEGAGEVRLRIHPPLSFSICLSLSPLSSLFLSVVARHVSSDALYQVSSS